MYPRQRLQELPYKTNRDPPTLTTRTVSARSIKSRPGYRDPPGEARPQTTRTVRPACDNKLLPEYQGPPGEARPQTTRTVRPACDNELLPDYQGPPGEARPPTTRTVRPACDNELRPEYRVPQGEDAPGPPRSGPCAGSATPRRHPPLEPEGVASSRPTPPQASGPSHRHHRVMTCPSLSEAFAAFARPPPTTMRRSPSPVKT